MNLMQGDCLELMKGVPDKSVDMILCDLPYGTLSKPLILRYNYRYQKVGRIL